MEMRSEYIIYISLIILTAVYLFAVETVQSSQFRFTPGGQDLRFSPYDVALVLVGIVGITLSVVSFAAYDRKKNRRFFIIALAFLFFTLKSLLSIVYNFFTGGYQFMGIVAQGLELLMILAFFLVLFRR
jgi:hypothetical protein